jgi:hypothetical protein
MYVYFMAAVGTNRIKIGKADCPQTRLADLQTGCPYPLRIIKKINCGGSQRALLIEKISHDIFREFKIDREWYHRPEDRFLQGYIQFLLTCANGDKDIRSAENFEEMKRLAQTAITRSRARLRGQNKRNRHKARKLRALQTAARYG